MVRDYADRRPIVRKGATFRSIRRWFSGRFRRWLERIGELNLDWHPPF